jgi:hypothetical protein
MKKPQFSKNFEDIPPNDQPYFEYANYHFKIQTDTTGLFGKIEAKVDDPTGVLEYTMDTNNRKNFNLGIMSFTL